jgi:hypothetical protein
MAHTTNYTNTFIEVAENCKADTGIEPPLREGKKSIARMQYELIKSNPYKYTSDELLFELHVIKNQISDDQKNFERERFFAKGRACMRSSDLAKRYGWGIHFDENSKMAIYAVDSEKYSELKNDPSIINKKAMRNSRNSK